MNKALYLKRKALPENPLVEYSEEDPTCILRPHDGSFWLKAVSPCIYRVHALALVLYRIPPHQFSLVATLVTKFVLSPGWMVLPSIGTPFIWLMKLSAPEAT